MQGEEIRVTIIGKVQMKWEKALLGIDYKEEFGRGTINISDDLITYNTKNNTYEIYRTRIIVIKAKGPDGKEIVPLIGKSLIVTGNRKAEVQEFFQEEVEIDGICQDNKEIDVISVNETKLQKSRINNRNNWDIKILSLEKARILDGVSGYTRMMYPASTYGCDYFFIVTVQATKIENSAMLKFTRDSTYLEDDKGKKYSMIGNFDKGGNYDPFVISWKFSETGKIKLAFCVIGEPSIFKLKFTSNFPFRNLSNMRINEK